MLDARRLAAPLLLLACTATGEPVFTDDVPAADPDAAREALTIPPRPPRPPIVGALVASSEETVGPRCDDRPTALAVVPIDPRSAPDPGLLAAMHAGGAVSLPLRETRYATVVAADSAETTVIQVFHNPSPEPVAALYAYPLRPGVVVDEHWIRLADREIHGVVTPLDEAYALRKQVRDSADIAALRELRWANTFTQAVADVPPGATVEVELRLIQPLRRADGRIALTLPLAFEAPGLGHGTVPCAPIDVEVTIDAGVPVTELKSQYHALTVESARERVRLELTRGAPRPAGHDLELSWQIAGEQPRVRMLADPDGNFTLTVEPPRTHTPAQVHPRELVFVLGTSAAMRGQPLETAVDAIRRLLVRMGPDDTFQIVRLAVGRPPLAAAPLRNTTANVARAVAYLTRLDSDDARQSLAGVAAALTRGADPGRLRVVLFLTDGGLGDEAEVLGELARRRGDARLFALGLGLTRNDRILDGIGRIGRGATLRPEPGERWGILGRLDERLGAPLWTDLEIDWGDLAVADVVPSALPDLLAGNPVVAYGRLTGARTGTATLKGKRPDAAFTMPLQLELRDAAPHASQRAQWARLRIAALLADPNPRSIAAATELAVAHRVPTDHTELLAIETRAGQQTPVTPPDPIFETIDTAAVLEALASQPGRPGFSGGSGFIGRDFRVPTVRQSKAEVVGGLDKDIVRRVVRAHINEVRRCYEIGLERDRNSKGRVAIEFVIGPRGKVSASAVKTDSLPDRLIGQCIAAAVRLWQFPRPEGGGSVTVVYPFVLEPG